MNSKMPYSLHRFRPLACRYLLGLVRLEALMLISFHPQFSKLFKIANFDTLRSNTDSAEFFTALGVST